MASTSDIKKGLCIKLNSDIYKIIEFLHVKPGKGPAFVRTKIKSVTTGKVIDKTFPSGHKIEDIRVENRKYQFLYSDGDTYHFMNNEDYNQIEVSRNQIDSVKFLKEGLLVTIIINTENSNVLSVEMPQNVILEVLSSEPGVKGNTATNATKPAKLETGAEINVPLFINEGDKIKVDTEKGIYIERKGLNFGHTIGHAIETHFMSSDKKLLHGEAIAIGIIIESFLSKEICGFDIEKVDKIKNHLLSIFNKIKFNSSSINNIIKMMEYDKKNTDKEVNFVLLSDIGKLIFDVKVPDSNILDAFEYYSK